MSVKAKLSNKMLMIIVALAALFAGSIYAYHLQDKKSNIKQQFHGTLLDNPRSIESFSLVGMNNTPFTNENLKGHWTMMFFGFTSCGHVCPMTMAELAKMYQQLETQQAKPLPQVVFISIDPKRDSLEKLKNYVTAFNSHFFAARAKTSAIKKMATELGIAYEKEQSVPSENYDIQHSGAIMLFNPQGQLTAFFTGPHRASMLAEDYQLLLS